MSDTFEIKLEQFEGPFDLLLFFIERDELNIHDIPISQITNEFLDFIHSMDRMNIEVASEFIVVAATLMRIKAKMLLPRKEKDEQGNEIDPREELVRRLLEYKRFKEAVEDLKKLEEERAKQMERGFTNKELKRMADSFGGEAELHTLTLFRLLKSFEKVMSRLEAEKNRPKHTVVKYAYSIESSREYLGQLVLEADNVSFERIFEQCENRVHCIFNFLALLEMVQLHLLSINIGLGENNFWISKYSETEPSPEIPG